MSVPRLILASRSPRRIELLREAGYVFDIDPADIDEDSIPSNLSPNQVASYLATEKARVVARRHPQAIVLGADTVVAIDGTLYGKAETPDEARAMLRACFGKRQQVITGIAIFGSGEPLVESIESLVEMRPMTDAELETYIASDQWRGKAGAYGIQDHDPEHDPFVRIVSGDYTNVVGLPMEATKRLLAAAGVVSR